MGLGVVFWGNYKNGLAKEEDTLAQMIVCDCWSGWEASDVSRSDCGERPFVGSGGGTGSTRRLREHRFDVTAPKRYTLSFLLVDVARASGCVPRSVEKERRPPLRHQSIRSGGNLGVFENLAQTLVAVDAS